jgi:hypothetical protein
MCFLPKSDELVKVRRGNLQNVLHVAPPGVAGPHGIAAIRLRHVSSRARTKLNNDLCLGVKPMHVAWLVVLRVRNKTNAVEP